MKITVKKVERAGTMILLPICTYRDTLSVIVLLYFLATIHGLIFWSLFVETTWHAFGGENKIIGSVVFHPDGQTRARLSPSERRWRGESLKIVLYVGYLAKSDLRMDYVLTMIHIRRDNVIAYCA